MASQYVKQKLKEQLEIEISIMIENLNISQ